jgi:hypothetical protein
MVGDFRPIKPQGDYYTATLKCPAGKILLNGGYKKVFGGDMVIWGSHPIAEGTPDGDEGWEVDAHPVNNETLSIYVYANCVNG